MASFTLRGRVWYAKIKDVDGQWRQVRTGETDRKRAEAWAAEREREVKNHTPIILPLSVAHFAESWLADRLRVGLDAKKDRGHLDNYILPVIGLLPLPDVRAPHLVEMITKIRTSPMITGGDPPSQRTVYNIYSTTCALFRDAMLAGRIDQTPCILTPRQLGPKTDSNPEWRKDAVFTHEEAETLISDVRIPLDRRVAYAIELLSGLRPGETAALRWRHYDPAVRPLGRLHVAKAFSTDRNLTKGTKTDAVKLIPVHPTLAAILAEWKLGGWESVHGRTPTPDDLVVPLPPADARARTKRADSEPHRTYYYADRRWRDEDLPALGWRHRRHYDMRATFITLALDDGADPEIIERRVTHTKKSRGAFEGYVRISAPQWEQSCAEVAKLRIARRLEIRAAVGATMVQAAETAALTDTSKLRRRGSNALSPSICMVLAEQIREVDPATDRLPTAAEGDLHHNHGAATYATSCDLALALLRGSKR